MENLYEAYLDVYSELDDVDEAMESGPRRDRMLALANHPRTTTQDRANIHNIAVRNDTGPSYQKKSTGGKGSRFPGYGDQGAGNKTARRMGNEPMRGNKDPRQQAEEFDLFDYLLEYLVAEGYANTNENAIAIMANMSEEWREEILDEAVRGSERSIANRITGNDIRRVTRGGKTVYKKPKWKDEVENKVQGGSQLRKQGETQNTNDSRDRERIEANKKYIKTLNANPGEDPENYGNTDDDHSGGERHYKLTHTNRSARGRRARGR